MSDSNNSLGESNGRVCLVEELLHSYGDHVALDGVDLSIRSGEIYALLGPNGSGKTTLFRLLCTLMPIQRGRVTIDGIDSATDPLGVRCRIGIVFQSPSLDIKLTVDENIACQGALYGIQGNALATRRDALLEQFRLTDRRNDFCETLSGGLKRRVELVKGMLHRPKLLLLDEPSTGLDPAARLDLWDSIRTMADEGITILMTTHLLEEADKADRVGIMADGRIIGEGSPADLRSELGQSVVTIESNEPSTVESILREDLDLVFKRVHQQFRIHSESAASLVPVLAEKLGDRAESISIGKPSLEDVFIAKTGQRFRQ